MAANSVQDLASRLTQRSDVALAFLLVSIIFMMILPMPTVVVDMLIGLNMGIAILLLMLSIYISSPIEFSSFPSVLMLTTLFRLSLAVATTRLILLQGDAGHIIQTFGEFVVGGNLVVGLVVFLIITIVQFIVITKGSERIAEVSARFSLDAMPGKQMSIDSDLRAGVITLAEARSRRSKLERESQLYGAMDGAMKFVKGDAIAGIIIIVVNILGGLIIGMTQRGMAAGDALQLYSILTIGDGLVSQIPALFISITAGIIVTRVRTDDESNLGAEIGQQLLGRPSALIAASGIVAGMGLVPGFPTMVFFFLSGLLGFTGYVLRKAQMKQDFADAEVITVIGQAPTASGIQVGTDNKMALEDMTPLAPVLVELPEQAKNLFSLEELDQEFTHVRRAFYQDLGVPLSGISLRISSQLEPDTYRISIRGIPVAIAKLSTNNTPATIDANADSSTALVNRPAQTNIQNIRMHLAYLLRKHAADFIGIQELHTLYSKMEQASYAELVREAQRAAPSTKSVDILRRLLSEGVSIRDLRQIMETLVEFGEAEKDTNMLTERVRMNLKRQISYSITNGQGILPVYMFAPETEKLLQGSIRQTPSGVFFALAPDISQRFAESLRNLEAQSRQDKTLPVRPVILTGLDLRRHVRKHIEAEFSDLPVLSMLELTPAVSLKPVGEIRLI